VSRRARGQALVELALVAPVLLALVAIPVASSAWAHRQLTAIEASRDAAWNATAGTGSSLHAPEIRLRVRRPSMGLVRAETRVPAPPRVSPFLPPGGVGPGAPVTLEAALELDVLPLSAGTEEAGVRAVRARWLGGAAGVPVRALIKFLIREEPIRVDFDARPSSEGTR
jgi:hypothetical protein